MSSSECSSPFTGIPRAAWSDTKLAGQVARQLARAIRPGLAAAGLPLDLAADEKVLNGPWDVIPFTFAQGDAFNKHPHLTVAVGSRVFGGAEVRLQLTVPNKARSHYWGRLRESSGAELEQALSDGTDELLRVRRAVDPLYWEPALALMLYQRRYHGVSDRKPVFDAYSRFDVDTLYDGGGKSQRPVIAVPGWFEGLRHILKTSAGRTTSAKKRPNLELALGLCFPDHPESVCNTAGLLDVMVRSAPALTPLINLLKPQ